jgi:bifunctional non-homologous end joining protein LigD
VAKRAKSRPIAEGAKPAAIPGFIKSQLATLKSKAPAGKHGSTRSGTTATGCSCTRAADARRPTRVTDSIGPTDSQGSPARSISLALAIIDGEAVVIKDGRTNFSELQAALAGGRQGLIEYYAFDLLYLDGCDLRAVPQIERKRLLKDLFDRHGLKPPLHYSEHLVGDGPEMFAHAAKLNWEGVVSKNPDAPYRSDRNETGSR